MNVKFKYEVTKNHDFEISSDTSYLISSLNPLEESLIVFSSKNVSVICLMQ